MRLLLDTHAFLWAAVEPRRLSAKVRSAVSDTRNEAMVSVASFWEVSLKFALAKLELHKVEPDDLPATANDMGFDILPMSAEDAASFWRLPRTGHRDPFDRMLAWQAIRNHLVLVTRDPEFGSYAENGLRTLW